MYTRVSTRLVHAMELVTHSPMLIQQSYAKHKWVFLCCYENNNSCPFSTQQEVASVRAM